MNLEGDTLISPCSEPFFGMRATGKLRSTTAFLNSKVTHKRKEKAIYFGDRRINNIKLVNIENPENHITFIIKEVLKATDGSYLIEW